MITLQGTYLTSDIARDGSSFSIGAMYDAVWQGSNGGTPTNITHDIHRTIGWTLINSLYLTPFRASIIGKTFVVENDKEREWLCNQRRRFLSDIIDKGLNPHRESFIHLLEEKGITDIEKERLFYNGIAIYHSTGIASKLFSELNDTDSKGLVHLGTILQNFEYLGQGIFKRKWSELCILVHPYLRKSQSYGNNYNLAFLEKFFSLIGNPDVNLRIRIDPNVIAYAPSFIESREYEYWHQPQYDDDIASIPSGLTSLETPKEEKVFNQIERTEFVWSSRDDEPNLKTLEVEEVIEEKSPVIEGEIYPCRYIHSQYDSSKSQFIHFDGAIRGYTFEQILERISNPMTKSGHNADYTKLFRIDGKLPLEMWKALITQFFSDNSRILQYFNVSLPDITQSKTILLNNPILDYVPCMMTEDDGVCINLSFFPIKPSNTPRYFDSVDEFRFGAEKIPVVESSTIDVKKMLCREGAYIDMPSDVLLAEVEDIYYNIPVIAHGDIDTQDNLNKTFRAIRKYIQKLSGLKKDMVYSFSLGFNMGDRHVILSFMGHVNSLSKWMKSCTIIPVTPVDFRRWVDEQYKILGRKFKPQTELIKERFIRNDGVLYIKRNNVSSDATIETLYLEEESKNVMAQAKVDENKTDLIDLYQNGNIRFASCSVFKSAKCTKGKCDYLDSPYIAVFDETCCEIQDIQRMTVFWTNGKIEKYD